MMFEQLVLETKDDPDLLKSLELLASNQPVTTFRAYRVRGPHLERDVESYLRHRLERWGKSLASLLFCDILHDYIVKKDPAIDDPTGLDVNFTYRVVLKRKCKCCVDLASR